MEVTTTSLLVTGISGLVACVVWLSAYIKKLHAKSMEAANKFTETAAGLKSSIDQQTKSVDKNTQVTDDLHKYILQQTRK